MKNELKFYNLMKYGKQCEIGYVAYNDGIWVNYKDIGEYFNYGITTYTIIWNELKDIYKELINVDYTNAFGFSYSHEEKFIHISTILDLAIRNDELSNNARNMVYELEKQTPLEGEISETEAVNEFLEIWRNPKTMDMKITYNVMDESTNKPKEQHKAYKKSTAKTTCPSWIREVF